MLGVDVWRLAESQPKTPGSFQAAADEGSWGLLPRALKALFAGVAPGSQVSVSYLEIYNEAIFDLLADSSPDRGGRGLSLHSSTDAGVVVPDAVSVPVQGADDVLGVLWQGARNRSLASTDMNEHSSRSHTIFMVHLDQPAGTGPDAARVLSKVCFVDLAGSEKIQAHQLSVTPSRMSELTAINQSLSCLGRCIRALTASGAGHVPYRESKLTRLLQDSLGGNTRTAFFITLSPSPTAVEESLSTLSFADRAKQVVVHAHVNERIPPTVMVKQLQEEVKRLKRLLAHGDSGTAMTKRVAGSPPRQSSREATLLLARQVQQLKGELTESEAGRRQLVLMHTYAAREVSAANTIQEETKTLAALRSQVLSYHKELASVLSANEALKAALERAVSGGTGTAKSVGQAYAAQVQELEDKVASAREAFIAHVDTLQEQAARLTGENSTLTVQVQNLQRQLDSKAPSQGPVTPVGAAAASSTSVGDGGGWTHHVDKKRARSYWHHSERSETTWHRPAECDDASWTARRRKLAPALEKARSSLLETLSTAMRQSLARVGKEALGAVMRQSGIAGEADVAAVWSRLEPALDATMSQEVRGVLDTANTHVDLLAAGMELR